MCIENFASQIIERHNKPEVEARSSKELLGNTVFISRNANEKVMIETSVNSMRISVCIKKLDELEVSFSFSFLFFDFFFFLLNKNIFADK